MSPISLFSHRYFAWFTYIHTLLRLPSTGVFSHNVNYYIILVTTTTTTTNFIENKICLPLPLFLLLFVGNPGKRTLISRTAPARRAAEYFLRMLFILARVTREIRRVIISFVLEVPIKRHYSCVPFTWKIMKDAWITEVKLDIDLTNLRGSRWNYFAHLTDKIFCGFMPELGFCAIAAERYWQLELPNLITYGGSSEFETCHSEGHEP